MFFVHFSALQPNNKPLTHNLSLASSSELDKRGCRGIGFCKPSPCQPVPRNRAVYSSCDARTRRHHPHRRHCMQTHLRPGEDPIDTQRAGRGTAPFPRPPSYRSTANLLSSRRKQQQHHQQQQYYQRWRHYREGSAHQGARRGCKNCWNCSSAGRGTAIRPILLTFPP